MAQRGVGPALGWACFLGSSWTWVIGMFWPILLVRDFGWRGWAVFAVPNVIGAAAMGFVLPTPERSRAVFEKHLGACVRFSEVTLAFHFFAATWLLGGLIGLNTLLFIVALSIGAWLAARSARWAVIAAAGVSLLSLGLFAAFATRPEAWTNLGAEAEPALSTLDLLLFAPASIVGFALCPYLDATFHRARQATDRATGMAAFALGFGGVFLAMIVFSLAYAGAFGEYGDAALSLLAVHWVVQASFTIGLHLREANDDPAALTLSPRLIVPVILGAVLGYVALEVPETLAVGVAASTGEVFYRGFLLFYGLVFPAYVWLVMWPTRRAVPQRVKTGVFIAATVIALPMAAAGFIGGASWWIVVALGVVGAARGAYGAVQARQR